MRVDDTNMRDGTKQKCAKEKSKKKKRIETEFVAVNGFNYIYCSAQKDLIHVSNISYIN